MLMAGSMTGEMAGGGWHVACPATEDGWVDGRMDGWVEGWMDGHGVSIGATSRANTDDAALRRFLHFDCQI